MDRPEDIAFNLQSVDPRDPSIVHHKPNRRRRCPIMVELTDLSVSKVDLARALEAGMNICKFRFSFSTKSDKVRMFMRMENAAERCAARKGVPVCPVATCGAIKTWIKKIGIFKDRDGPVPFPKDAEVILTCDKSMIDKCTENAIYLDYDHIASLKTGQEITIGYEYDDKVEMHCLQKVDEQSIKCKVTKPGQIASLETAFFRNFEHTTPFISHIDISILKFILRYQVDILFIYYAKDGDMIRKIKTLISKAKIKPMIFSGICNQNGIDHLDELIEESDGIIMCRDILELELPTSDTYRFPMLQKWMAGKCQEVGMPFFINSVFAHVSRFGVITDTEIADVTNALLDGVTGFILKDYHDIENTEVALHGLNKICCEVEPLTYSRKMFWRMMNAFPMPVNAAEAAVVSTVAAANQTNARIVIVSSVSGLTARMLLCLRPACIVITVTERMHAARMMYCCRNLVPIIYKGGPQSKWAEIEEARIQFAADLAVSKQWMEYGDIYVTLQRSYEGHLFCDTVKVMTVTFAKKMLVECHYDSEEEEDKESKDSLLVLQTKKKKRKKKKKKVEEAKPEEKVEEEERDDDEKDEVHHTISSATESKMAAKSEMLEEEQKEEQDEEQKDEEQKDEEEKNEEEKNEEGKND
ncbi:pyruvate kinase, barrel domain-containing protein [Phthorimaea operculella]|nr:pyruvate kinase, barrel domain-containing protein [Phthorimaea operculella]